MISRSLILQISQAAKIMRRFFYEAPAEIMRIYTTGADGWGGGGVEHQQDEGDEAGGHVGERARDVRRRISCLYPGRM